MERKDWYKKTVPYPYHLMKNYQDESRLYNRFYNYVFSEFFGNKQYKTLYNGKLTNIPFTSSDVWVTEPDGKEFKKYSKDPWLWLSHSPAQFDSDAKWAKTGRVYIGKLDE